MRSCQKVHFRSIVSIPDQTTLVEITNRLGEELLGGPADSEDRPRSSTKKNWVDSMWDESEIREFDLQMAVSCLKASYPENRAT